MRAIVIHSAKDLRLEEREIETPGNGEVAVQLAAGGICGSDLHYYNHGGFGAIRLKEPMILGHEVSGHIAAVGNGVIGLKEGDLVAVSPSRPCGSCVYCQRAQHNHCENMRFFGSAMPFPHIQGAFRQNLVANASQCVKADGLTAGEAAMAEPLSVCLHAVRRAGDLLGKKVLITGSGPIGALCILAARASGAADITVTDLSESALSFARKVGADRTINVANEPNSLAEFSAGKGSFDAMFECSGSATALDSAIPAMRPQAIIMQLGLGGDMKLPVQAMTAKELELRGSFRFHKEFPMAVQLMKSGKIDVKPLISNTFNLEKALDAFECASDKSQAMKVQIAF